MTFAQVIDAKAVELGQHILSMTTAAGSGHPSSALSILHIVLTLMRRLMRFDPADPWNPAADRLVLSEGHAVPAVYAVYADLGGVVGSDHASAKPLRIEDLASLRELSSPLDGHPNPAEGFPFFDAATGSLGQGLSVGAGLACAARLRKLDRRIFVLIGDGEAREGQIWEAADFIVDHRLTNVSAIFNCNGQGQADYVSPQQSADALARKLAAFGWEVRPVDGHDAEQIESALSTTSDRPIAVVARTQKGWGVDLLKDKSNHGKPLTSEQLPVGAQQLAATAAQRRVPTRADDAPRPRMPARVAMPARSLPEPAPFGVAMKDAGLAGAIAKNACATRRAYGAALVALGRADERIIAFDGDVSNSTFAEMFAAKFPERFFECKIAEQNMISAAAGAAAAGLIPFASSFAKFIARAYDQIEMAQITRANVKIVGSHAGISLAADGPSQMSLHDVAYFRSASESDAGRGIPACVSFHPADAVAAYHCTWLMARHPGMCYMRTHRPDVALLYPPDARFEIGGSHTLLGGRGGEPVAIVSAGYMVHVCKQAAEQLASQGIHCTLIDAYSFPLRAEPILAAAERGGRRILVVEDNYVGGLASAIAEAAAMRGAIHVHSMTCRRIPKSARTPAEILRACGLSPEDIAAGAMKLIHEPH
ncbi:MAG: transketolase [Phycisphaerae bacterium]|nr:transketolase [Phycisphaerae bacterium]